MEIRVGETFWIPMDSGTGLYAEEVTVVTVCECLIILRISGGLFGFMMDEFIKQIGKCVFTTKEDADEYISRGGRS